MSSSRKEKNLFTTSKLPAALIGTLLLLLFGSIWLSLEKHEEEFLKKAIKIEANEINDIIHVDLKNRIQSLQRMVSRWEMRGGTPREEFLKDAQAYVEDDIGYQSIQWVDRNYLIKWLFPIEGNEKAIDLDLVKYRNNLPLLEEIKEDRLPRLSEPFTLVQGGTGLLVYLPIFIKDKFDGVILAVFRTQDWLDYILHSKKNEGIQNKFTTSIFIDGKQVFKENDWEKESQNNKIETVNMEIYKHQFFIQIKPTGDYISEQRSYLPHFVFALGILLSILISTIIYLAQKAHKSVEITLKSKKMLESEIAERNKIELLLKQERERLSSIIEGTDAGTWEWNIETGELVINERWAKTIGYTLEELSPTTISTWTNLTHFTDYKNSVEVLREHLKGKLPYYEFEVRIRHKEGYWVWVLDRGKVTKRSANGHALAMSGTHQDITKRKLIEDHNRHLATHDALTHLPSLRYTKDRLRLAIEISKRNKTLAAVMFLDLDGFKAVNDSFGHDAGDFLLQEISKRLASCIRKVDLVGRIGGDEFLIILTNLKSASDPELVAKKMIKLVNEAVVFNDSKLQVGASIGISIYPDHAQTDEDLISLADKAMYYVKNSSKNSYSFAKK